MMKKRMTAGALAALMAASLPITACAAQNSAPQPQLNTAEHMQYMNGYTDGTFRPDASITRAEASKLLASLLVNKVENEDHLFNDVSVSAWYADAVRQMTGFGLVNGYTDGTFKPNAKITRAEFVAILSRFPHTDIGTDKSFADVPRTSWAYNAVQTALAQGWISAGTNFRPNAPITRAETVTILNRVLGRQADEFTINTSEGIRIMPDVPNTHWAYWDMLEATTDHKFDKSSGSEKWTSFDKETTDLMPGWHNIGGKLFHVNEDKQFDHDKFIGSLELDHNGYYITGSTELDALLASAVKSVVKDSMTQQQKLRAVYDYAKNTFGYLGIGAADTSKSDWALTSATDMLKTHKGNCYSWAAGFTYLARQVGFDAQAIPGTGVSPKGSESVHAWTEITIDGTAYTFDPQIESVYKKRYNENYDLFMKKYGEAVWGYKKDETTEPEQPETVKVDEQLSALMSKIYGARPFGGMGVAEEALYNGMGEDGMSRGLFWYLGTDDIKFEAGVASESMITSQAHSIVVLRFADEKQAADAASKLKTTVDPRKWICVGVDEAEVVSKGKLVCVVMDDENGDYYINNFKANA